MILHWTLRILLLVILTSIASAATASLLDDLAVHLKFNGNLKDAAEGNSGGTAKGSVPYVPGLLGQAVKIAGNSNYISLGYPDELKMGADTDFSVSFWTRFSGLTGDPSFLSNKNWNSGNNRGFIVAAQPDGTWMWNYRGEFGTRAQVLSPTPIDEDRWHHLAVTFDRDGLGSSYLNGELIGSASIAFQGSIDTFTEENSWNIGQDGTGTYTGTPEAAAWHDLRLDDLGIWRRVLSTDEINSIYENGLQGKSFDEPLTEFLPGDLTLDGLVTPLDFDVWRAHLGLRGDISFDLMKKGDANFDGIVDLADFRVIKSNLAREAAVQVPEPAGWPLALTGLVALCVHRLRRRLS